jgi:hypothetical protein
MARQEAVCWSCGTRWADEHVPVTALRVIDGGAGRDDRWIIDGGSLEAEPAAQIRLTTGSR